MPYTAEISRVNPGCFLFLVDQSGSMEGNIGGQEGLLKKDQAADAINRIVDTLSQRCSSGMDVHGLLPHRHLGLYLRGVDLQ